MDSRLRRLLDQANDRLSKGRIGVSLVCQGKGDWLYVRGVLPPKPGSVKDRPHQQRVALNMRAIDPESIKQAELTAKAIGISKNLGTFDWRNFSDYKEPDDPLSLTIGELMKQYEAYWWEDKDRNNGSKQQTWGLYWGCLKRLPTEKNLTEEVLLKWITGNTSPNTEIRRRYVNVALMLAKYSNLELSDRIKRLSTPKGVKPINPRDLPSDADIAQQWEAERGSGWQWIFGMLAAYGLRPHEVFKLDMAEFPIIRVGEDTKTGYRAVKPLYPEWAEQWGLHEVSYPIRGREKILKGELSNAKYGQLVKHHFYKKVPFPAYNLRHAYARRGIELEIPPDVLAKLMGHSLEVHLAVYRSWVGESVYLNLVDKALSRRDRSLPPLTPRD